MDGLPERVAEDGRFPFGILNGPRPVRPAASGVARQIVIGTYPSALHIGWSPPAYVSVPPQSKGRVASLAVSVEPVAFWDGHDANRLVEEWMAAVGFVMGDEPGGHGQLSAATNGPSGAGLADRYFPALPFAIEDTAFLDVYPVYFVKKGTTARRGQAEAIEQEYNSIVAELSGAQGSRPRFVDSQLPLRPTTSQLPHMAAERFAHWLVSVVMELEPQHVVTLGEEVWATLDLAGLIKRPCAPSLSATRQGGYGRPGELQIAGSVIEWTALAHPGAVRQSTQTPVSWGAVHSDWLNANRRL